MRNINLEIEKIIQQNTRKNFFHDWFEQRGLDIEGYQQEILCYKLIFEGKPLVLAVSPGGGKTLMAIAAIDKYCLDNPTHRVLVLTHAQTNLRSQFANEIIKSKPDFSFSVVVTKPNPEDSFPQIKPKEILSCDSQVILSLPHSIRKRALQHFDLIVVDEAHQYYFKTMDQTIIEKTNPSNRLLLTGTPSPFILRKDEIIAVSLQDLYKVGRVVSPSIELASSTYDFTQRDFNNEKELKSGVVIKQEDTIETLNLLLQQITKKTNSQNNWTDSLKMLSKTMIVCRSQPQAKQVYTFFETQNINVALSISKTDTKSSEIRRFIDEKECHVLIVVGRGILGFNFTELANVIDMSCSQNIDRILQLLCRVVRNPKTDIQKQFFKVIPMYMQDHFIDVMRAVACLTIHEYYIQYNGRSFFDIKTPVIKAIEEGNPKINENGLGTRRRPKSTNIRPVEITGVPLFDFFEPIKSDNNEVLDSYARTSFDHINSAYLNFKGLDVEVVFDIIYKEYVKGNCKRISDLKRVYPKGLTYLNRNKLVYEFGLQYGINSRIPWNKMPIKQSYPLIHKRYMKKNCSGRISLSKAFPSGYRYLVSNGLLQEFRETYDIT